jgi:hypothetical protein
MLRYVLLALTFFCAGVPAQAASPYANDANRAATEALAAAAGDAARLVGVAEAGDITCDPFNIRCTCTGAFHCAWLALGCAEAGGITGLDGECFLPGAVPASPRAVNAFAAAVDPGPVGATCDGIFCSCTGGADSPDCQKLVACIDDVSCIGDSCGCIGGRVDE